ncbi:hypothetical protein [Deinococcus rubellus]|uniref:Uncharacterized protein n=1 Tax=Deinococcus rubellus TaxID=1889240 RepID=A0ABY5YI56_9DEIO|nr:hypothetical protein [Deinococcus rubellus]UWX64772.1 hypothetical protein N0D28_03675 [Deinococcus rubellus]
MRQTTLLALLLTASAQAQTWTVSGSFTNQFLGCVRTPGGSVQCTMTSTYIGAQTQAAAYFFASSTKAFTPDGQAIEASSSSVAGKPSSAFSTNVSYKDVPVKVVYTFPYPHALNTISMLMIDTGTIRNVAITPSSPTAASSSAALPAIQLGTTQAVVGGKAYTISLTNCKLNSGNYTCTSTLVPLH